MRKRTNHHFRFVKITSDFSASNLTNRIPFLSILECQLLKLNCLNELKIFIE